MTMSTTTSSFLRPDIPTEIHLSITDHLPLHSIACLALTCKRLLHIHGTTPWTALKSDRNQLAGQLSDFLLLLERDLPEHYLADYHATKLSKRLPLKKSQRYSHKGGYLVLGRFGFTITWDQVVLVLKRERNGEDHGLPLEIFSHQSRRTTLKDAAPGLVADVTIDFAMVARIVYGRVLLRCTYNISASAQEDLSLAQLKFLHLNLCRHTGTVSRSSPWYDNTLAKQLSARHYTSNSLDPDSDVEDIHQLLSNETPKTLIGNCSLCMTDWIVEPTSSISQATSEPSTWQNWFLFQSLSISSAPTFTPNNQAWKIVTWQNLGSCDSPYQERDLDNDIWKAFAGGSGYAHLVRVLKYPKGCVREAVEGGWEEGERLVGIEGKV